MNDKFDPNKYLRKLQGQDYLEVKWRLVWLRSEHPDAEIETELIQLDTESQFAIFKATVALNTGAKATGFGSEQRTDFKDYIEKAETKAVGRALGMLGYGTQFSAFDFDEGRNSDGSANVVDSPVSPPVQVPGMVTPQQKEQIIELAKKAFAGNRDFISTLSERYKVGSVKDLSEEQAKDFITWMQKQTTKDTDKPF